MMNPKRYGAAALLIFSLAPPALADALTLVHEIELPPAFLTRTFVSPGTPIEPQAGAVETAIEGVPGFDSSRGTLIDILMAVEWELTIAVSLTVQEIADPSQEHMAAASVSQGSTSWTIRFNNGFAQGTGTYINAGANCAGTADIDVGCTRSSTLNRGYDAPERSLFGVVDVVDVEQVDAFDLGLGIPTPDFLLTNVIEAEASFDLRLVRGTLTMTYIYDDAILTQDSDGDGVRDLDDACMFVANPNQRDVDEDGYGDLCDADVNNDCIVNIVDLGLMRVGFFSSDPILDFNADGVVNVLDLGVMRAGYFDPPGPSGLTDQCD